MKLNRIAANQTEIDKGNGVIVFFSYSTPVSVFVPGKGGLVTSTKYSITTQRHVNKTIERWGCSKVVVDQDTIDRYADR